MKVSGCSGLRGGGSNGAEARGSGAASVTQYNGDGCWRSMSWICCLVPHKTYGSWTAPAGLAVRNGARPGSCRLETTVTEDLDRVIPLSTCTMLYTSLTYDPLNCIAQKIQLVSYRCLCLSRIRFCVPIYIMVL